ncbi:MAG TPA: PIG-L family deacetylase [Gemmataceae bacterium]|jgi:bacillithiol biosynthesis deacetylase BshB1|nr:PIG-L family deacetylase [Gemmataceae bacterium]
MSNLPGRLDVVAVAPHPDDLEITCGATLAKLVRQGYRVGIIDLTSGEPTPRGSEEIRAREAEAAREALGVQVRINLALPNRVLMDGPEGRFRLATELRRLQPSILITVAGRTPAASPDHHQGHLLVEAGRFYSQLTKWDDRFADTTPYRVPHLVYALTPFDAEQRTWHSTFVVDVSDTLEQKIAAIRFYESQFDASRLTMVEHFVRGKAATDGARCGYKYGELFALPHPVGTKDLMQLIRGSADMPPAQPGQDHMPMG